MVAIGGGHGLASALEAIQTYAGEISALVSVADDGGSSGRLSDLGHPPPGDVRRCLLALTPEPSLWSELFAHRFAQGDVADHSLGNLILAGLAELYGDFGSAVTAAERMLGTVGSVIPISDEPVSLTAVVDGAQVAGQRAITATRGHLTELSIDPPDSEASLRALLAIAGADQIVIGPGSLFTSVIAALMISGVSDSIAAAGASRVLVLNLMTQDGETFGLDGSGHLQAVAELGNLAGPGSLVVNTGSFDVPDGHSPLEIDEAAAASQGWVVVPGDVVDTESEWPQHDPIKLGLILENLVQARG